MSSFFNELKQRKVYRVAVGYAVVAWLVVQISATVIPAYHAPEWILPLVITAVALGFPVALVLAWAFDIEGGAIKKTPESTVATVSGANDVESGCSPPWFNYQCACDRWLLAMASVAQSLDRSTTSARDNASNHGKKRCRAAV